MILFFFPVSFMKYSRLFSSFYWSEDPLSTLRSTVDGFNYRLGEQCSNDGLARTKRYDVRKKLNFENYEKTNRKYINIEEHITTNKESECTFVFNDKYTDNFKPITRCKGLENHTQNSQLDSFFCSTDIDIIRRVGWHAGGYAMSLDNNTIRAFGGIYCVSMKFPSKSNPIPLITSEVDCK